MARTKKKVYSNGKTSEEINSYNRNRYIRVEVNVRYDDYEVLEKLDSVPSKSRYILELIRKDIAMNNY